MVRGLMISVYEDERSYLYSCNDRKLLYKLKIFLYVIFLLYIDKTVIMEEAFQYSAIENRVK